MKPIFPTIVAMTFACAAFGAAPELNQKALRPAVEKYLEQNGNFCLGKFDWPITVTEDDRRVGTNDALQMPVLEKLGLVVSSASTGTPGATSYDLTQEGRKSYLVKKTVVLGPGNVPISHAGDFCAAKLTLDRVVAWQPPELVEGRTQTTVKYTYKVTAGPWAHDPEVQKVFPMIHRIVDGGGTMQLTQLFAWSNQSWVAVTPGE